jgi:chemotaxis family two-component system sensor kinase Cph1
MTTLPRPDLARCADEPIRVPGSIQPHGWLAVLDAGGRLVACSQNWPSPEAAAELVAPLKERLAALPADEAPAPLGTLRLADRHVDVSGHRIGDLAIVECEPAANGAGVHSPLYTLTRQFLPRLQQAGTVQRLAELAAAEMKRLTGFGRCLVYRFDEQDDGEVIAESLDPGYDSYAGHHFPASDIPPQARELYLLNHLRLIPDADYTPVPIAFLDGVRGPQALDLTYSALRSVSPVHLEYMRNMGTRASMSVSIVVGGRLWGLVSCHDHAPRRLSFPVRAACEHLGRLLSMQIESTEDNADVALRLDLRRLTLDLISHMADSDATLKRLVDEPTALLRLARAGGAAVVLNDDCWTAGDVPPADAVLALARWIGLRGADVFHTDRLAAEWPAMAPHIDVAAGVLAVSISQVHRHVVLWFRPEYVRTVRWAGDPDRRMTIDASGRIHPRRSFGTWRQKVGGRSVPWQLGEVTAALELRQALVGIVLRRAEELNEVATELGRVNKELEAFSYTVSHDLRAPMRHIAGYVDLVFDNDGPRLTDASRRYLRHVKEAAAFAGQLVDALLDFSRMGRSALKHASVDTQALVSDTARELSQQEAARPIEWDIAPALPRLWGDPLLIQVAVRNLMANAVKYTRGRTPARIRVGAVDRAHDGVGLEISDNGVGFQMAYVGKLFGVFQRLHASEDFEGTGIGLANVRRVVERHGGEVWARGVPGQGATFGFVIPRQPASP